jgi:hypothetical protein
MHDNGNSKCTFCHMGYQAPFDRFEKIATIEDGPAFLMKCSVCRALWHETLHAARSVSPQEARSLYKSNDDWKHS